MMEGWVQVSTFTYPHEAHLAKSLLEASGIDVIIKDELTVQVVNLYSNAIGGVKMFVEKEKYQESLLLLEEGGYIQTNQTDEKKALLEIFSTQYQNVCPYCESSNVVRKKLPGYIFALSILFLSFPLPFLKRSYYCYDCCREWKVKK